MEKQVKRKEIYDGKVIKVVVDDIELNDGRPAKREIVMHNGGACIALKDIDGKYLMVKQYRYAHQIDMLEFCAGKIEIGEKPDSTIVREVQEELGYTAKNIKSFGYIIPTCGYSSERIYLYYGEVDKKVNQHFDEDEYMETYKYSFNEIKDMIKNNVITDAKTIAVMYQLELNGVENNEE